MTREEFKQRAQVIATHKGWTLDIVEDEGAIEAWFSEVHPLDQPGKPYGPDVAQAYMRSCESEPVGLVLYGL